MTDGQLLAVYDAAELARATVIRDGWAQYVSELPEDTDAALRTEAEAAAARWVTYVNTLEGG